MSRTRPKRAVTGVRIDVPMRLREIPALTSLPRVHDNPEVVYCAFIVPASADEHWLVAAVETLSRQAAEVDWTVADDDPEKWVGWVTMTPDFRATLFKLIDEAPPEELERSRGIRRLASLDAERRETVSVMFFSRATR